MENYVLVGVTHGTYVVCRIKYGTGLTIYSVPHRNDWTVGVEEWRSRVSDFTLYRLVTE